MLTFFRTLLAEMRTLPLAVWVLTGGQFINRFGSFVFPFMALYLQDRGLALAEIAWVLGAISLGGTIAPFAGGYLADAIGRRNTIVISLVGSAVSVLAMFYSPGLGSLLVWAVVHGGLTYMFGPAANALLTDLVPAANRVVAFAVFRLALNAGFAAGPAVAGILFTLSPALIFWGDAATTLIFAGLAGTLLPTGLKTVKGRVSSPKVVWNSWREAARDAGQNRPFLQLLGAKLLMAVAFVQIFNVLALDATTRGLSLVDYGLLMGCNGLIIVLVELPLVHAIKRFPPRLVAGLGFAVIGLGCAAFAGAETMAGFLAAMALFTLGEMVALPVSAAYGAHLAPAEFRGRYFGFFSIMWGLSALVGSAGVWIYGQIGVHWWWITGAFGLAAGALMAGRVDDRRLERGAGGAERAGELEPELP